MSFESGNTGPFMATDKIPAMNRLVKSAAKWHGEVDDYIESIQFAGKEISKFLVGEIASDMDSLRKVQTATPEELKKMLVDTTSPINHPVIFPYAPENQHIFKKHITTLITASHAIYPVILNINKEVMASIKPPQPQTPTGSGPSAAVYMPQQPQQRSWFDRNFKKSEKLMENVTDITAYSRSVNLIDELMQIPVMARKFTAYHWERVTDSMTVLKNRRQAQINLLAVEIINYHSIVDPMIMIAVGEAMRLNLESEKRHFETILGNAQKAFERREAQMQFAPPTQ